MIIDMTVDAVWYICSKRRLYFELDVPTRPSHLTSRFVQQALLHDKASKTSNPRLPVRRSVPQNSFGARVAHMVAPLTTSCWKMYFAVNA